MSKQSRIELIREFQSEYRKASWSRKGTIIDSLTESTGYSRKHLIALLNHTSRPDNTSRKRSSKYDQDLKSTLIFLWHTSNHLCSKRLVPFMGELIDVLEKHGHLNIKYEVREKLLHMSAATVDRLLQPVRHQKVKGITTTVAGNLLKKQIPVRTFTQWNDAKPGFFEADLVAHSGSDPSGQFLQTLTLTDISTQWTECIALLRKGELEVRTALQDLERRLPFPFLGLDTDNGFEFINYNLFNWCLQHDITFTRGRPYKKNDQAYVEERNGSVVRRLTGYDRLEGRIAWHKLSELYSVSRLYTNFFQPSCKLVQKKRFGAKVWRKYDQATTPYHRLLKADIPHSCKEALSLEYEKLDPLKLLNKIHALQSALEKLSVVALYPRSKTHIAKRIKPSLRQYLPLPSNGQKKSKIRQAILSLPPYTTFQAIDLMHLTTRVCVDQTLSNLTKQGLILRVGWGVYRTLQIPTSDSNIVELTGTNLNEATNLN